MKKTPNEIRKEISERFIELVGLKGHDTQISKGTIRRHETTCSISSRSSE